MSRKTVFFVLRVAVALGLIAFVVSRLRLHDRLVFPSGSGRPEETGRIVSEDGDRIEFLTEEGARIQIDRRELADERPHYGLLGLVRDLRWGIFAIAFVSLLGTYVVTTARWQWLCRVRRIRLSFADAFRFSFLGFFFNNAVPGATGGDVMKAYFASRNRASKTEVFASVILDRIIGLVALVFLAGGALFLQAGELRFRRLAQGIYLLIAVLLVAGSVYYSRRLRRLTGLEFLGRLLPYPDLVRRVDRSFFLYRLHKGTLTASFFVSFLAHFFTILNHILIGSALGLRIPMAAYFAYVPIGQVASAIPVLPGGWGVREAAYGYLFLNAGLSFSQGTALSALHGLTVLVWSLLGGVFFMVGHERLPGEGIGSLIDDPSVPSETPATTPDERRSEGTSQESA